MYIYIYIYTYFIYKCDIKCNLAPNNVKKTIIYGHTAKTSIYYWTQDTMLLVKHHLKKGGSHLARSPGQG